jgi:membrane protein involved in colicin uptake
MTQPPNLSESETKRYSDYEVDLLIEDLSEAAREAIEKAAADATKAAALAALEREAAAVREAAQRQAEALRWHNEAQAARRNGIKNAVITGAICLLSGLALGVGGTLIIGGQ